MYVELMRSRVASTDSTGSTGSSGSTGNNNVLRRYIWSHWKRQFSEEQTKVTENGYCTEPCTPNHSVGCYSQKDCESTGNQWIVEGIVDSGATTGGHNGQLMLVAARRQLQTGAPTPPPPGVRFVGRCIDACARGNEGSCRNEKECINVAMGKWYHLHQIKYRDRVRKILK